MYANLRAAADKTSDDLRNQLKNMMAYSADPNTGAALKNIYSRDRIAGFTQAVSVGFFSYLFYASLLMFTIFLVLVFIHFTVTPVFSLSPNQPGFISVPTVTDKQTAYTTGPASSDLSANVTSMCTKNYTVGFDLYLTGDFNVSEGARVLLYKSTDEITTSAVVTPTPDPDVFSETDLVVWLDPVLNDLYVGTFTTRLVSSAAVSNLPIRKPVRITVVFSDNFIEVYKNGTIEQTLPLPTSSRELTGNPPLFPPIKTVPAGALLGNLAFWPRILSAREIRANGLPVASPTFFNAVLTKKVQS